MSNFYEKLEKNSFENSGYDENPLMNLKLIGNSFNKIIDWSINNGNHHFAITINCIGYKYDGFNTVFLEEEQLKIKNYLYKLFPTTTWFFIVSEETKGGMLHFHAIIAIRNFIDYNYTIKNNLINCLFNFSFFGNNYCDFISTFDIKVQPLNYFRDVKNWVMYMHKDIYNWRYRGVIFFFSVYVLNFFFSWYPCLGDIYHTFIENENIKDG